MWGTATATIAFYANLDWYLCLRRRLYSAFSPDDSTALPGGIKNLRQNAVGNRRARKYLWWRTRKGRANAKIATAMNTLDEHFDI